MDRALGWSEAMYFLQTLLQSYYMLNQLYSQKIHQIYGKYEFVSRFLMDPKAITCTLYFYVAVNCGARKVAQNVQMHDFQIQ